MLAAINWNARHSAREWVATAVALVIGTPENRQNGERTPPWKHFDDTHHWDPTSEEWVPNIDR
jgi:hypothetical protein